MTHRTPPDLPAGVPILRLFRARARRGSEAALADKLRTSSIALVQHHPAFLGLICGGPAGKDERDFLFATLWRDFDGLLALFGAQWAEALLPDGYAELIEACAVEHFALLADRNRKDCL